MDSVVTREIPRFASEREIPQARDKTSAVTMPAE
jgi:hypothetical protein